MCFSIPVVVAVLVAAMVVGVMVAAAVRAAVLAIVAEATEATSHPLTFHLLQLTLQLLFPPLAFCPATFHAICQVTLAHANEFVLLWLHALATQTMLVAIAEQR